MKKTIFSVCAAFLVIALCAGISTAAKYKPGVYQGEAKGYNRPNQPGEIAVEVTVDENTIKDIKVTKFVQSNEGRQGEAAAKAQAEIPAAIVSKQSLAVDSVAKASASSMGIEIAVAQALEQATVAYKDGKYTGKAKGYDKPNHPGEIEVQVTIAGGKISNIEVVAFKQTEEGKQGEVSAQAKAEIPAAIVAKQSVGVDSVAKASMSSDGIKVAVARALEQAR